MASSGKRVGDLSRLNATSISLENAFLECLRDAGVELGELGQVQVTEGDTFVAESNMVTMMDFSGAVSGFAAFATDSAEIRKALGEPEAWTLRDMAEDMLKEFVNQAAQEALEQVKTEDGILSCSAPRTIYGTISIPSIPCVTRSYPNSRLKLSFSMALDRMKSDLVRVNTRLLTDQEALRSEIGRRRDAEERLEQLASTDVLTGSVNRRKFMEIAQAFVAQARENKQALSVIMADIDHFKRVNDTYGHAAGDLVIQTLGQFLKDTARNHDIVGRLGGEEFGFCLPDTSLEQAKVLARRICERFPLQEIQISENQRVSCTISLGVAQLSPEDADFAALLHRADMAMYASKRNGRNQVATAA